MRYLIAGLGSVGRRHLRNLLALGERDIILYRTYLGAARVQEPDGFPVQTSLRAALDLKPDAVIVSNPTALHLDVAIPAAEAGCHLLIEKPVSHTLERIDALRSAVERRRGRVLVGYHFRHHPVLQKVRLLIAQAAIGSLVSFHAHWGEYLPDWHPGEDYRRGYSARRDLGGGPVLTLSHVLDYARWLLGEVKEVWAFAGSLGQLGIEVEDTAEIGLRFASGATGSIHLDYLQQPPRHYLEIVGARGTLLWDASTDSGRIFRQDAGSWEDFPPPEGFERNTLFMAELAHFIAVAEGRASPACNLEDGIRALELASAVQQSAEAGLVVKILM